jgi:hypothetical protein
MSKSLMACILSGLFAFSAGANDITIYFGRPETVPPTTAFVPDSACPGGLVQPYGTCTVGIWANVGATYGGSYPIMDVWNCIGLNIVGDPGVLVSDLQADNSLFPSWRRRWETSSDLGGGDNGITLAAVTAPGLGGLCPPEWESGPGTDWWSYADGPVGEPGSKYRYWLGNVTLSYNGPGAGNVYFQVGGAAIVRSGGSAEGDLIYFGEDEPVPLHGNDFGEISSLPDFVFIPEPAALLLAFTSALAMRRR